MSLFFNHQKMEGISVKHCGGWSQLGNPKTQKPKTGIRKTDTGNQKPDTENWNPDIMNDDRDNSLQQCL